MDYRQVSIGRPYPRTDYELCTAIYLVRILPSPILLRSSSPLSAFNVSLLSRYLLQLSDDRTFASFRVLMKDQGIHRSFRTEDFVKLPASSSLISTLFHERSCGSNSLAGSRRSTLTRCTRPYISLALLVVLPLVTKPPFRALCTWAEIIFPGGDL
jgi:hypothetical protein